MANNYLNKISKEDALEFTGICKELFDIDYQEFIKEINLLYRWHDGGEVPKKIKDLQDLWYNSLKTNPLYEIYDEAYYLADCWACWKIYSRNYLKSILHPNAFIINDLEKTSIKNRLGNIKTVVDVGCGIGYSTLALKDIFPNSSVCGTNLRNTKQWSICEKIGVDLYEDVKDIKDIDLMVAFEYFEHFEDPIEHLKYLIKTANPKYMLIANSFGTNSIGHFINQSYNGAKVPSKGFGRIFNKELKKLGYRQQKTKIFNNKPSFWINEK